MSDEWEPGIGSAQIKADSKAWESRMKEVQMYPLSRVQEIEIVTRGLADRQPGETDAEVAGRIIDDFARTNHEARRAHVAEYVAAGMPLSDDEKAMAAEPHACGLCGLVHTAIADSEHETKVTPTRIGQAEAVLIEATIAQQEGRGP